jgi:hypothetical protein
MNPIKVYIFSKDEKENLPRCLNALYETEWPITVLESGETCSWNTEIGNVTRVEVRRFDYQDHAGGYNRITADYVSDHEYALILDADMILSTDLITELSAAVAVGGFDIGVLPIEMWWCGRPLKHGSLYPPKALLFRGGETYFVPFGHGEKILGRWTVRRFGNRIRHDDRKPYERYLVNQTNYGERWAKLAERGRLSVKDRIRVSTPFAIVAYPLLSWLVRLGVLSGRLGLIYALDRAIAESIFLRMVLLERLNRKSD